MNNQEIIRTLTVKYGVIETLRYYLRGAKSAAASMKVGAAENNPMQAVKDLEVLIDNLQMMDSIIQDKDNRPAIIALEDSLK